MKDKLDTKLDFDWNKGYFYAPYIPMIVSDPSDTYTNFMAQYKIDHQVCPNCGSDSYISTLMGYVFNSDDPKSYKDQNNVKCEKCDWEDIAHDLVKKN